MKQEILANDITLYLGDCRDVLPTINRVDAVITDPPYGNGTDYIGYNDTEMAVGEFVSFLIPWVRQNAKRALITPGNRSCWLYPKPDWTLAWVVPAGTGRNPWGFTCWQPILAYGSCPYLEKGLGSRPDIFIHTESSDKNGHPCPKPIRFMRKLVERGSLAGDIVLDPFMGSGTTGSACYQLGRKFIGIEKEQTYFDIACREIDKTTKQGDMFIMQKEKPIQQLLDLANEDAK